MRSAIRLIGSWSRSALRRTRSSFSWMPAKIRTATSHRIQEVDSGRKSLARPIRKSSWSTTVPRSPIKSNTTPFQVINPASVTTNDGMPIFVMIRPWKVPIAIPDRRARPTAIQVATSLPSGISRMAAMTPATPET